MTQFFKMFINTNLSEKFAILISQINFRSNPQMIEIFYCDKNPISLVKLYFGEEARREARESQLFNSPCFISLERSLELKISITVSNCAFDQLDAL